MAKTPEMQGFVLRSLPPEEHEERKSRAERERDAAAYWDGLTVVQEEWALRKMGLHRMGMAENLISPPTA